MKRASFLLFTLGAAALLGAEPAQADEKEAESCLRTKIWDGYSQGWRVRSVPAPVTLAQSEYRIYLVTLYKGNEYKMFACGDAEARDVGLVLHDADGNVLVQDEGADREPLLSYTPSATDTYFLAMHASQLNNAQGKAGIGMAVTFR